MANRTYLFSVFIAPFFFLLPFTQDVKRASILSTPTRLDQSKREVFTVHCMIKLSRLRSMPLVVIRISYRLISRVQRLVFFSLHFKIVGSDTLK